MNRIALHQSSVHPLDPVELVQLAATAGVDSIGLRVAAVEEVAAVVVAGASARRCCTR